MPVVSETRLRKNSGGDKEMAAGANYRHSFWRSLSPGVQPYEVPRSTTIETELAFRFPIGYRLRPAEFPDSGEQHPISSAAGTG